MGQGKGPTAPSPGVLTPSPGQRAEALISQMSPELFYFYVIQ